MDTKPVGMLIGYARVSTDDQELRLQKDALTRAGCYNIYEERSSAFKGRRRPQLEKMFVDLREGDTLVVWRLDRLGRDMRELIRLLDRVRQAGAGFKSLTENMDLTTPVGRLMFHVIGAFAQFESDSTAQRTAAGIKAIQERGMRYGAKPKLTEAKAAKLIADAKSGEFSKAALGRRYKISAASVTNYVNRAKKRRRK